MNKFALMSSFLRRDRLRFEGLSNVCVTVSVSGSLWLQTYSQHVTTSPLLVYTKFSLSDAKIYTWGFLKRVFPFEQSDIYVSLGCVVR